MRMQEFIYERESASTVNEKRKVMIMNQNEQYVEGLDLSKMTPDEADEVIHIFASLDTELKPYMKYYRKFFRNKMVD